MFLVPAARAGFFEDATDGVAVEDLVYNDILAVLVVLFLCAGVSGEGGATDIDIGARGSRGGEEKDGD